MSDKIDLFEKDLQVKIKSPLRELLIKIFQEDNVNKNNILERISELEKDIYRLRVEYIDSLNPKAEPETIILPSGETWVAYYDGVDYLCLSPDCYEDEKAIRDYFFSFISDDDWKPIKDITITDKIAKLRPMLESCIMKKKNVMLLAVIKNWFVFKEEKGVNTALNDSYRLAKVKDLQEANNEKSN